MADNASVDSQSAGAAAPPTVNAGPLDPMQAPALATVPTVPQPSQAIVGSDSSPAAPVLQVNTGLQPLGLTMLNYADNIVDLCAKPIQIQRINVSVSTSQATVLWEATFNPWSETMVSKPVAQYGSLHEVFNGDLLFRIQSFAAATIIGSVVLAYIPPELEEGFIVDLPNLTTMTHVLLDLKTPGSADILFAAGNLKDACVSRRAIENGESNYGKLILAAFTDVTNSYGAEVPIPVQLWSCLGPNGYFSHPSYIIGRSNGGLPNAPVPPLPRELYTDSNLGLAYSESTDKYYFIDPSFGNNAFNGLILPTGPKGPTGVTAMKVSSSSTARDGNYTWSEPAPFTSIFGASTVALSDVTKMSMDGNPIIFSDNQKGNIASTTTDDLTYSFEKLKLSGTTKIAYSITDAATPNVGFWSTWVEPPDTEGFTGNSRPSAAKQNCTAAAYIFGQALAQDGKPVYQFAQDLIATPTTAGGDLVYDNGTTVPTFAAMATTYSTRVDGVVTATDGANVGTAAPAPFVAVHLSANSDFVPAVNSDVTGITTPITGLDTMFLKSMTDYLTAYSLSAVSWDLVDNQGTYICSVLFNTNGAFMPKIADNPAADYNIYPNSLGSSWVNPQVYTNQWPTMKEPSKAEFVSRVITPSSLGAHKGWNMPVYIPPTVASLRDKSDRLQRQALMSDIRSIRKELEQMRQIDDTVKRDNNTKSEAMIAMLVAGAIGSAAQTSVGILQAKQERKNQLQIAETYANAGIQSTKISTEGNMVSSIFGSALAANANIKSARMGAAASMYNSNVNRNIATMKYGMDTSTSTATTGAPGGNTNPAQSTPIAIGPPSTAPSSNRSSISSQGSTSSYASNSSGSSVDTASGLMQAMGHPANNVSFSPRPSTNAGYSRACRAQCGAHINLGGVTTRSILV